jgi:hypothetical protein
MELAATTSPRVGLGLWETGSCAQLIGSSETSSNLSSALFSGSSIASSFGSPPNKLGVNLLRIDGHL